MSDEKQKKRSEMTDKEEIESYDRTVNKYHSAIKDAATHDDKLDEILGTSPKKKEGLFEKLGCLGSVVFIIFVLVLLKLLFLF